MRHSSSPYGLRLSLPLALLVLTFSVPSGAAKGGPKDTTMGSKSMSCPFVGNDKCPNDFGGGPRTATTTRTTAVPCQGAVRNLWSNPTTPTSWGKSGTGTVSGSTFTDSDAATATAVFADDMPGVAGAYTVSCTLRSGTLSVARVQIFPSGGGGGGICTHSLTSDAQRFACTQTITGTPTNVRALVYAGSATADTGTINLDQCQFERAPSAGDRCDSSVCYGSTSGIWQDVASNTACIAPGGVAGVESYGAVTNYWTNSTTPTLWSSRASPVVTGNEIGDDTATDFEGKLLTASTTTTGPWTSACYVRAGTQSKATLKVDTDATGDAVCVFNLAAGTCTASGVAASCGSEASGSGRRIACYSTVTGSPTFVSGQVFPTDVNIVSETGSIFADQCQTVAASTPGRRCDSGGTATTCAADQHTVSTTGWPTSAGRIDVRYTPANATDSGDRYLLDSRDGVSGVGTSIRIASNNVVTVFTTGGSSVFGTGVTWTAGQSYLVTLRWSGTSYTILRDGVQIGSGTSIAIASHATTARIGSSYLNTAQANGTVSLVSIGEP